MTDQAGRIIFVLKGYPRLSETFIAQEILALERLGFAIDIVSLRHPTDKYVHPSHREIKAKVGYLPEYLYQEPKRVIAAWRQARKLPGYSRAWRRWLKDFLRDPTPNRARRFGQACVLAAEMPRDARRLHAHFMHTPASVAYYAHLMTGMAWSCSAHAKDIWTIPEWEKREKIASLDWMVTCTAHGHRHLQSLAGPKDAGKIDLVYHGLDFERFGAAPPRSRERGQAAIILSVGRAVPKKGYLTLMEALAQLPAGSYEFHHVGGGPLMDQIEARAKALGIQGAMQWLGPQPQEAVLEEYRTADIFVLASEIAPDGDRDGLPNVLMEAQSQGLPIVATTLPGIQELVIDEETGLLCEPGEAAGLARCLNRLIADRALRDRLGAAGKERVLEHFSLQAGIQRLALRFKS